MPTTGDLDNLHKAIGELYDRLKDAYWAASTIEAKDQIQGAIDLARDVIDALNQAGLDSDNADLASLNEPLKAAVKDLTDLQSHLEVIVHNVAVATSAVAAIDKVLTAAGKIIPLAAGA